MGRRLQHFDPRVQARVARLRLAATATATGDGTQRWLPNADGQIVNEASGRCLDVGGQATADGSKVILYSCNGGANKAWTRR
ncbi:RICIN domain-containing protein [Streptomyces sp. NPDC001852]|uniref:RICIN domain-containing protein n=1 Tax=Streptomyces sp. NPDC001852 TaxID=3364619 RepID=UPI0036B64C19